MPDISAAVWIKPKLAKKAIKPNNTGLLHRGFRLIVSKFSHNCGRRVSCSGLPQQALNLLGQSHINKKFGDVTIFQFILI